MKKKNFLKGFNAKTALAVVALSGALLTGCYKDDGLDVDAPVGEVILPAPTYTILGTVVDAETLAAIPNANVTGDATATVANGSFSVKVAEAKSYTLQINGLEGYEDAKATVDVKQINKGQSAVYSTIIAMQPKMDGKYTLKFDVRDANGNVITTYQSEVTEFGKDAVLTGALDGGKTYLVKVSAEGFVTKFITLDLPKVRKATDKVISVVLNKVAIGKVKLFGEMKINNNMFYAKSIKLYNADNNLLGIDEGYTYTFEVSESEFKVVTRASGVVKKATFKLTIIDQANLEINIEKTYTIVVSEDGSVTPGVGEGEAGSDVVFKINTSAATSQDITWGENVTAIIDYCNDESTEAHYKGEYTPYIGSEINAASDYKSKMSDAEITVSSGFYSPILTALGVDGEFTGIVKDTKMKDFDIVVPALTYLKSFTYSHAATQVSRSIESITVNDQPIETLNELVGAKSVIDNATGLINAISTETTTIGHAHGHGHGHGDNQNAGGGIIDAE